MKIRTFILAVGLILVGACTKSSNPLLGATDGQFIRTMNFEEMKFLGTDCEAIFFNPSAAKDSKPGDRNDCANRVKENAALAGISNVVKLEHIEEPQVKERYFKLKK